METSGLASRALRTVRVWDLPLRLFHWLLVAAINPERVGAIEKTRWGGLVVRLLSGAQIPVGRKFRAAIQAFTSDAAGG